MTDTETDAREVVTVESGTLALITGTEIDRQIATAKKFPRSLTTFLKEATGMVAMNESIAAACIYALPRDGKTIEGPSARFAEIIASAWGNCRAGARVVNEGAEFITSQGVFQDLERNVAITYEVQRRITDKNNRRYKADMIGVTGNAACSIALRNAILKGIPKAFWEPMYETARRTIMGDFKTLDNRRADAIQAFQRFGVRPEQIYALLEVQGIEDVTMDHLVALRGMLVSLKDGDSTPEQLFGAREAARGGITKPRAADPATPDTPSTPASSPEAPDSPKPQPDSPNPAASPSASGGDAGVAPTLSDGQIRTAMKKLEAAALLESDVVKRFGKSLRDLPVAQFGALMDFIADPMGA
jgi:hypothetical protein